MIHAPMRIGLVGAGQRGNDAYGAFALADPGLVRFVAVAEPDPKRRIHFAEAHGIDPSARFDDITTLLGAPIELDGLIIATPDRAHVGPASAALEAGYPVLLEKPIATTEAEIQRLKTAVVASNGNVTIAHPLRYTAFFTAVDELLRGGAIGRLIGIEHLENIGAWHFAHSYVRGNWRRADESSPMILAKACHDLDILRWLADADCASVASFGSLRHFRPGPGPERSAGALSGRLPCRGDLRVLGPALLSGGLVRRRLAWDGTHRADHRSGGARIRSPHRAVRPLRLSLR